MSKQAALEPWQQGLYGHPEGLHPDDEDVFERMRQLRIILVIHACLYYDMAQGIIPDSTWDNWGRELVILHEARPDVAAMLPFPDDFEGWTGGTAFNMKALSYPWVILKAKHILALHKHGPERLAELSSPTAFSLPLPSPPPPPEKSVQGTISLEF